MSHLPLLVRVRSVSAVCSALLFASCTDFSERLASPTAPIGSAALFSSQRSEDVRAAIAAQERHTPALMRIKGVVGTAVGVGPNGQPVVQVLVLDNTPRAIPSVLDGIPAHVKVTGMLVALSNPATRARPAPLGFSVGHPSITAGTIGALVMNPSGTRFVLSNNHVLANSNAASIGDPMLQPGPFDGGTAADQIGTLAAFRPIDFAGAANVMDAAIAVTDQVSNFTPLDDGYGLPNSVVFDDANGDGLFDDRAHALNVFTQKYGRTTKLTHGRITGINATVDICYEVLFIFCIKSARFTDQLIIGQSGFSAGGDSGSLIVTDDANKHPIGLLFAGSSTETIANRIDLVLTHFGVSVDGSASEPPPPPDPVTDVAINSVSAPASITQGATVNVSVQVRNAGNQSVGAFDVAVTDQTDGAAIGTQSVSALAPGASTTLTFPWNTSSASLGAHTIAANHSLTDDNAANNSGTATVQVNAFVPTVDVHVGDLDGSAQSNGTTWSATVEVTVHDADHAPINGATVVGTWSPSGLNSDTCTTGELGGNGTCIFLFPSLRKSNKFATFTVTSVTMSGKTYQAPQNHDPDGSSNGTTQRVNRP
jgi:hypothetical protein